MEPRVTLHVPIIDISDLPSDKRETEIACLTGEDAKRPFDLTQAPLLRAKLVRLDRGEYVLLLALHHIVSDAWSRGVLYRELSELYRAYRSGQARPLPELPVQYADFVVWQRRTLDGGAMKEQLAYWKKQLGGRLSALELPLDKPRPTKRDYAGARQTLPLSESFSEVLRSLSRREGVTVFMTLLAAFQLLLYRVSGREDIIVGTPIAGRNRIETEALIGFFIGTLVIRSDLSGNLNFEELLRRTRRTTLDAYEHQDVPFEKLVEEVQPERDLARNPIFDIFVNYFTGKETELPRLDDLFVERLTDDVRLAKFSLTLYIRGDGPRLVLALAYQTALFSSERIACLLEQYRHLLEQICADPKRAIRDYS
ncbi:MAG: condensation domain-containing protein, partial [Burkholderiales bacterium]